MKTETNFVAERPLASHCPELFGPEQAEPDLVGLMDDFTKALAKPVGAALTGLVGGDAPLVEACASEQVTALDLAESAGSLAACHVMRIDACPAAPIVAIFEAAAVFRLVDKAFGGRGDLPDPLPEEFSLSATLFLERLGSVIAQTLSSGWDCAQPTSVHVSELLTNPGKLPSHLPGDIHIRTELKFRAGDEGDAMSLSLAFPPEVVTAVLGGQSGNSAQCAASSPSGQPRSPGTPTCAPFADIPLPLEATLVDMRVGLARLSGLKPGDVLPVAVARSVPLRANNRVVAHGVVGDVDDRVALQITTAF